MDLINKVQGFSNLSRPPDYQDDHLIRSVNHAKEELSDSDITEIEEEEIQNKKKIDKQIEEDKKDPQAEALLQEKIQKYQKAGIMEKEKMKELLQLTVPSLSSTEDEGLDESGHVNVLG